MIPQVVTVGSLAAAVANYFAVSATPTSGTNLTLAHTTVLTPRRVLLTYGNEASPRTLALVGLSGNGAVIKETLAVPSGAGGTVGSVQDFLTLTSATPLGSGWTAAMTLGTSGVASSPWNVVDYHLAPMNMAIGVIVSGTVNYTIEYTYDDLNKPLIGGNQGFQAYRVPNVFSHSTLASQTANSDGFINDPIWAWRLTVNSGATGTDSVTATAIQGGLMQGNA